MIIQYLQVLLTIVMQEVALTNVPMTTTQKITSVPVLQHCSCQTMKELVPNDQRSLMNQTQFHPQPVLLLLSPQLKLNFYPLIAYGQNGVIGQIVLQLVENQLLALEPEKLSFQPGMSIIRIHLKRFCSGEGFDIFFFEMEPK